MKKILLFSAICLILLGCKKNEDEPRKTSAVYLVAINVLDNVNYSIRLNGGSQSFVNATAEKKNASQISNASLPYGETMTVEAELGFTGRGTMIEIIVTKSETGEVVFSDKKIDKVSATWTSKK